MSIIQVAKIQHRSGNISELPQLDTAEFGLAVDTANSKHRLFIGPVIPVHTNTSPVSNNIEVLTIYSSINRIVNGSSNVSIMQPNANITIGVSNVPNVVVIGPYNSDFDGNIIASRQVRALEVGNRGDNSFSPATPAATGNAPLYVESSRTVANLFVDGAERANVQLASAGGNAYHITFTSNAVETYAANVGSFTGDKRLYANSGLTYTVGAGNTSVLSINGSANVASNINLVGNLNGLGTPNNYLSGNWVLAPGATFQATYADLAEYYVADAEYEAGTVLEFSGTHEVTIAEDETQRVAGVVSTSPAYGMNASCKGEHVVPLALQGRVPCKVRGIIRKGDMMVSGGGGYARPTHSPKIGTIIGKALQDFEGEGVIEVAVGRI